MATSGNTLPAFVCECGDHAWKPLSKGFVALVDLADRDKLDGPHYAHAVRGNVYARSRVGFLHRRIMMPSDGRFVDHRNGNSVDNRRQNLRECSPQENVCNQRKYPGSSSFKGVSWDKRVWRATIVANRHRIELGRFDDEVDAAKAYDKAALRFFGQFARTNKSMGLY